MMTTRLDYKNIASIDDDDSDECRRGTTTTTVVVQDDDRKEDRTQVEVRVNEQ
jgi:hypothetical protein